MAKTSKKADKGSKPQKVDKSKGPRAEAYEKPLTINGSFEDLVKELVTPSKPTKE